MSAPVRPETPHPAEYLQYLHEVRPEDAKLYEQYLTETGQAHHIATAGRQQEFRSGRLERRVARENLNDQEALELAREQDRSGGSYLGGVVRRIPAALATASKDIPGAEALQAAARSGVSRLNPFQEDQSYTEALGDIREGYEGLNKGARIPLRIAGAGPAAAALPIASPALAGAAYGGLSGALDADPTSVGGRVANTAIGAGVGGAVGKVADVATTAIRARLAPRIQDTLARLAEARAAKASPLYDAAAAEGAQAIPAGALGPGRSGPEIQQLLQEPDIAPIVTQLLETRKFRGMAPDSPEVLDAIYKALSDQGKTIGKQLAVADPSKPNIGRFAGENIAGAKRQFLDAVSGPSTAPGGPMPSYRPATQAYAEGSQAIEAAKRGFQAARVHTGSGGSPDALLKNSPETLEAWLASGREHLAPEAVQGALGMMKRSGESAGFAGLLNPLRGQSRNALLNGGDLLRQLEGTATTNAAEPLTRQTLLDFLRRAGTAAVTPSPDF